MGQVGAPDAVVSEALGMQQLQVTQQRHRLDCGLALEDRQQILFPDLGQRVRAKVFGNGRPRSTLRCDGRRGSTSMRRLPSPWAVRSLKPARAAAVRWLWVWRSCM